MKKALSILLALMLAASASVSALAEDTMRSELLSKLGKGADNLIDLDDQSSNMYQNAEWASNTFTATPSAFDLRDRGVVPEVRDQGNWGTCWGFAAIAASEISILSEMDTTVEGYQERYGQELNLSEKHLAWFGTGHLPLASDYAQGEYPYPDIAAQAGEGLYQRDAEEGQSSRYNNGGFTAFASSAFAAGVGPRAESEFPYAASDGTSSTASDWTLPDSARFGVSYELENSHILPSPSARDANGAYAYNPWGTAAIKDELLNGRAVAIAYHADQAMDPNAQANMIFDLFSETYHLTLSKSDKRMLKAMLTNDLDMSMSFASEEKQDLMKKFLAFIGTMSTEGQSNESHPISDELRAKLLSYMDDPDNATDEMLGRTAAKLLGVDYDEYQKTIDAIVAAGDVTYLNTQTYAQYTDDINAPANHAVTVVGWDDEYAVENFPEDHQPSLPGAWIVRNSWGKNYGNDGYFYLSYYDQTIAAPESFDFVVSGNRMGISQVDIMGYDYMMASSIGSVQMDEGTAMANVFTMAQDSVLSDVSVMTADFNTNVTLAVYLLNEDAKSPIDGTMLDTTTQTFLYAGYHRIELNQNYAVPAGSKISVVQAQRVQADGKTVYAVPYTNATNEKYMEMQNVMETHQDYEQRCWTEGRIGQGESFVRLDDGEWADWKDIIDDLQAASEMTTYLSYDNLNIKLYAYPLDEVKSNHSFGDKISYFGAEAEVCNDCGYTIVEQ